MVFGAYIDGFNLYYGLKRLRKRSLYWLNLETMCEAMKPSGSTLAFVKFFTARSVETPRSKGIRARQELYWRALRAHCPKLAIIEGKIMPRDAQCEAANGCGQSFIRYQEKETDVRLGIELVRDCLVYKKMNGIILVTRDTDQKPTLEMLKAENPNVHRRLYFPPGERAFPKELTGLAHRFFPITTDAEFAPVAGSGSRFVRLDPAPGQMALTTT